MSAPAAVAVVAGVWLAIAFAASLLAARRWRRAAEAEDLARRAGALVAASPTAAMLVMPDGRIEADGRVADWLGLSREPSALADLLDDGSALASTEREALVASVRRARTGATARVRLPLLGSARILAATAAPAPPEVAPPGSAIVWFGDRTELAGRIAELEEERAVATRAFGALSAMIEAAPFPIWHRGPDLRLALVNEAYVAAVEAPDARAVIDREIELVEQPDASSGRAAAAVRDSGETLVRTVPVTIAGERRMLQVIDVPLGEAGVAGYALDVDELERARAELGDFAQAQRALLDRLSAGVAQFRRDRTLSFWNQPFARLFRLEPDWLAEEPEFDRVLEQMREHERLPEVRDFPAWKAEHRTWFISDPSPREESWQLPGGTHVRVVAQPSPDGGLLLIFEDRTEQLQLASARDTLVRVRTATFDNLFEAIAVFAADGSLQLWNARFRDVWGFADARLAQHPRVDALLPELSAGLDNPEHAGLIREMVRAATIERRQRTGRVSLRDGRNFEFAAVPLPDGNALFTMLDITASHGIEEALRQRNEALEDADRIKSAFVSNMSYELRTPLTSIGGFAEMLGAGYAGELPATAQDYVAAITDSVGRLSALIDDVLDLTQSEAGGLLLDEELDLAAAAQAALERVDEAAERKGVRLALKVDKSLGGVRGDARRIAQALDHLLRNAVEYTDEGGRVVVAGGGDAEEARLTVSDNGRGIAPREQARVFDRFHRAVHAPQRAGTALGLGLPLTRQFIEAHGGSVELHSQLGQGTSVTIRLPRRR
ncbi:MAG: FIG056333: sensor [uncultured Sphingomonadaceae bacterium]|uniref:histidine kinase n=1 Tax=uncultured Sphingomonadaceae bacterium TaxID=169976 RepID=A0A6J4T893_9SPHN|nr:MAG: FIG056333: sensor [uncultured Sphingomonadaceae bacterium]